MKPKNLLILLLAAMNLAMAGCSDNDSSVGVNERTSHGEVSTVVESKTEYDSPKYYDDFYSQYHNNYYLKATTSDGTSYEFSIKDELAYYKAVNASADIITIKPDDKIYRISDSAKVYSIAESDYGIEDIDALFGATGEFDSAYSQGSKFYEIYNVKSEVANGSGSITYIFDGSGTLVEFDILLSSSPMAEYHVVSVSAADESLFALPDLSGYTLQ